MKHIWLIACLLINISSTTDASPGYESKLEALYAALTHSPAFNTCKKISKIFSICAAFYLIGRLINDHRNHCRKATIAYNPNHREAGTKHFGQLTITTDGLAHLQEGDQFSVTTELINPQTDYPLLSRNSIPPRPTGKRLGFLKKLWLWFTSPSHRHCDYHIISVPRYTDIVIHSKNKHMVGHPTLCPIVIRGTSGTIEAHANSGSIVIENPQGNVDISTPDHAEISQYGAQVTLHGCNSHQATSAEGNTLPVQILP